VNRRASALIVACLAAWPSPTAAQDPVPEPPRACVDFQVLSPGCRAVELYGGYFVEAWNFNGRQRVTLPGVTAVFSTSYANGWGAALEALGTSVKQPGPNTFVSGVSAMLRRRVVRYRSVVIFVEGGVGVSYSTAVVPARGTRFNYLLQGGCGMATHLAPHVGAMVSLRVFHLSNANYNGPSRNPDIEALGGRLGLFVVF
jgi:Lipid A 3-O-deacylase (PagL)